MIRNILFPLFSMVLIIFSNCHSDVVEKEKTREFNGPYSGDYLEGIAYPIGGIGAGMFCIEGSGAISHISLKNKPDFEGERLIFSAISVKGIEHGTKMIEGPVPDWKVFGRHPNAAYGTGLTTLGLPRLDKVTFQSRFPFAKLDFKNDDIPLDISLEAWSPFIPADEDNSSLPVGALEYTFKNTSSEKVEAVYSFNSENIMREAEWWMDGRGSSIKSIPKGFVLLQEKTERNPDIIEGAFAAMVDDENAVVNHSWFRGGMFDVLTMLWKDIKNGVMPDTPPREGISAGASIFVPFTLEPGETKTIRLKLAWYVSNSNVKTGRDAKVQTVQCDPETGCCPVSEFYEPWYAGKFENIDELVKYWRINYAFLKENSQKFQKAFYDSSLPDEVLEAVAANLSILKSPTVLRQKGGKLWGWEGCTDSNGCCPGSCTHVWNYAQAIPHLFPALERSLRETEFFVSQDESGHQEFRSGLPIRPVEHSFHAAVDGQLGGIMKVYREWRISGDTDWLKKIWPAVKQSMAYAIKTWDPEEKGVIDQIHHNTYDIEFRTADGMSTSFYIAALETMVELSKAMGEDTLYYHNLYSLSRQFMEKELYNGEYFQQLTDWSKFEVPEPVQSLRRFSSGYTEEGVELFKKEGPKYQYGTGCLSDGILGFWIARMCGLGEMIDPVKVKSNLTAIHKYNLRHDLSDFESTQRGGYACRNDGGLLLCSWPNGGKPSLPFIYSDEVWTGIEYQVASHCILEGLVDEGLEIVQECRKRYDGRVRNPFDEYECGHWYARAMSSYGLIQALTGVRYDAVDQKLYVDSKVGDFKSFLSTEYGFGTVELKNGEVTLDVAYGEIPVKEIVNQNL